MIITYNNDLYIIIIIMTYKVFVIPNLNFGGIFYDQAFNFPFTKN